MKQAEAKSRDDFPKATKLNLALRAAHRCSNPSCRIVTVKPGSSGDAVTLGVAAHICGASSGGPRFDSSQTEEERSAASNGIWLCHNCSDRVDKDYEKYPAELLRKWKTDHEAWVAADELVPKLPVISVNTLAGLVVPNEPGHINSTEIEKFREHDIVISSSSRHEIEQLRIRVQFPEPVWGCKLVEKPPGVGVDVQPERMEWVVSGGGSVTVNRPQRPKAQFLIQVQRILPGRLLHLRIRTAQVSFPKGLPEIPQEAPGLTGLATYAQGEFLYRDGNQFFERRFIVPLSMDEDRKVTAQPVEEDDGTRMLIVSKQWG